MNAISKKTIWLPVLMGIAAGLLVMVTDYAKFAIPTGLTGNTADPREIFYTLCAAFAGPLGMVFSLVFGALFNPAVHDMLDGSTQLLTSQLIVRSLAMLWVMFAYKFIHKRIRSQVLMALSWVGIVMVYYHVIMLPFMLLVSMVMMGIPPADFLTYWAGASGELLAESVVTTVITTLIFIGLPKIFKKPLWYEPKS